RAAGGCSGVWYQAQLPSSRAARRNRTANRRARTLGLGTRFMGRPYFSGLSGTERHGRRLGAQSERPGGGPALRPTDPPCGGGGEAPRSWRGDGREVTVGREG